MGRIADWFARLGQPRPDHLPLLDQLMLAKPVGRTGPRPLYKQYLKPIQPESCVNQCPKWHRVFIRFERYKPGQFLPKRITRMRQLKIGDTIPIAPWQDKDSATTAIKGRGGVYYVRDEYR